jgi:FMN phosphatase YigB (HAD superfamily)
MLTPAPLLLMLDVDNTLLDNDRFTAELGDWLERAFGRAEQVRYWAIYDSLKTSLGYADYLGALQQFRAGNDDQARLQEAAEFMLDYPFCDLLYPDALAAIAHLRGIAPVLVLSDGDMVFQPRKIRRSGIAEAVDGQVLVYVHKQHSLDDLRRRYPAGRYAMVDDKPLLLSEMKRAADFPLQAIFVRQGHYAAATDSETLAPPPDRTIDSIGELLAFSRHDFQAGTFQPDAGRLHAGDSRQAGDSRHPDLSTTQDRP